jgi:subtilisin family serine protease
MGEHSGRRRGSLAGTIVLLAGMVGMALPSSAGAGPQPSAVPATGADGGIGHAVEAWDDPIPGVGAQSTGPGRFGVLAADVAALDAALATISAQGVVPLRVWRTSFIGFVAELTPEQADALRAQPGVTSVERERAVQSAIEQLEPVWNLDRLDQVSTMPDLYYSSEKTGAGVPIYVFDTGLNISVRNQRIVTHNEFTGRVPMWVYPFDRVFKDGCPGIRDCNGHGTHVAGTAAGSTFGVAKEAWIIPVKVFNRRGESSDLLIADFIYYVLDELHVPGTPAVANLSIGGTASAVLDDAIQAMVDAGMVVVVAAGNEGQDACSTSPARVPDAITVGAVAQYDLEAGFSNWGSCLDIYAPGVDIYSASHKSTTGGVAKSGTSMAAPHVAGAAALEMEDRGPGMHGQAVWDAIAGRSLAGEITFFSEGPNPNLLLQVQREVIPRKTLQLERTGGGKGKVTFTEPQSVCGIPCVARLPQGTPAVVSAVASPGSYFTGWSGDCEANGPVCALSVDDDTILTANFIVPAKPGAPTGVAVTPGNRTLGVTWSPPADDGGAPITGYQYTTGSTWKTVPSTASTFTITGLSNGRSYQVRVRAVTMAGYGPASTAAVGTPRTVPSAPSITSVTPGNGQLTVKFTAPSTNGAPISAYEYSVDDGASFTTVAPPPASRTITIGGLTNGTTYQVKVRAVNAAGAGAPSRAKAGTPRTVPAAPTITAVVAGSRSLTLTIAAPASTGGSPITSYQYSLDGGVRWSTKSLSAGTMKLTSLRAGTTYSVVVRAVNAAGAGPASVAGTGTPTN